MAPGHVGQAICVIQVKRAAMQFSSNCADWAADHKMFKKRHFIVSDHDRHFCQQITVLRTWRSPRYAIRAYTVSAVLRPCREVTRHFT